MSDTTQTWADTRRIIADTCRAYSTSAHDYAVTTRHFDAYPGLREEITLFEKTVPQGFPMLDLGCGGGRDSRLLADLGRPVIAGDICPEILTSASELSAGQASIGYVRLDMLALPFANDSLGGIWACGSMLHLPSRAISRALSEAWRALTIGGCAAISMRAGADEGWREGGTLPGRRWFTHVQPEEFAAAMSKAGFDGVRTQFSGRPGWFVALGHKKIVG